MDLGKKSNFNLNLRRIQLFGWWKIDSNSVAAQMAYGTYKSFSLFWLNLFTFLQLADLYDAGTDLETLSMNLCGTSVSIVSVVKTAVVLAKAASVENLYLSLRNNLHVSDVGRDEVDRRIIIRGSEEIAKLTKMFFALVIPTIFGWSIIPFLDETEETKFPLRLWMPFDGLSSPKYELFYAFQVIGLWLFAVNILSQDLIFYGFVIQICSQYEILEKNLKKLDEFCVDEAVSDGSTNEKALIAEIKKSIFHHQQILRRIEQMQLIYQECLFTHFSGALPLLCVIGFNIISVSKAKGFSTHMMSQLGYVASTLFDLFFFCSFGERLKQKGLRIAETVYDGVWYKVGTSPRKLLMMIMTRAQRSPGVSAGHIFPLNLRSFLQLLRIAYNILAVMNQMSR